MEIRYPNHPEDSKHYTTEELRENYLVQKLFEEDKVSLTYTHVDRMIFGGIMPKNKKLKIEDGLDLKEDLASKYFLERR